MLVTLVHLMYQATVWLCKWRSNVRCMSLIRQHLCQSSVTVRQSSDTTLSPSHLLLLSDADKHAVSTSRVLWTYGSRQLIVLPSQVAFIAPQTHTL